MNSLYRKFLRGVARQVFGCVCYYRMGMSPLEAESFALTLMGVDDESGSATTPAVQADTHRLKSTARHGDVEPRRAQ